MTVRDIKWKKARFVEFSALGVDRRSTWEELNQRVLKAKVEFASKILTSIDKCQREGKKIEIFENED